MAWGVDTDFLLCSMVYMQLKSGFLQTESNRKKNDCAQQQQHLLDVSSLCSDTQNTSYTVA